MSGKPASLTQIERWMQSVIMHPGGVAEGVASSEARAHLDVGLGDLESVIGRSRALGAAERLEIYVDAYYERLLECLSEEFAATRQALGDELFHGVAFGYLQSYPSRSYTLNLLGAQFPRYLAESRLHEREVPREAGPTWGDFIVELVTFERLLRDVFDAAGSEGQGVLAGFDLDADGPGNPADMRLAAVECLRLARFAHPVHDYWQAVKDASNPAPSEPCTTLLAICRRDYVVERHELSPPQFALLEQLVAGQNLAAAVAELMRSTTVDVPALERDVGSWFAEWTARRYFAGFTPGPGGEV